MRNSIGAFPNMSMMMTMFNQLSDLDVSQQFGFRNQEDNNQTQILMNTMTMNNFSRYFDVLLMKMQNDAQNDDANPIRFNVLMFVDENVVRIDITNGDEDDFLKIKTQDNVETINKTAKKDISNMTGALAMINMNIPLLKTGSMLMIVDRRTMTNDDGALSVTIDNKLMDKKPTLMAILTVVFNNEDSMMMNMRKMMMISMMMVQENTNSNNKKLTNNCEFEINTENINFSHCCDDEYETIFNVSVFLSQKLDIMMQTNGSVMMMMINRLQSHLIQSFIVEEHDDDANIDDDDEKIDILTEPTSTTSQSNTNKSEYAFERTLNNFNDDANVARVKIKIIRFKLNMMESTTKLFSFMQFWCPSFDDDNGDLMVLRMEMETASPRKPTDEDSDEYTSSNDDDDAGYMMISDKMQLCHESLLQSFKESDQQSGIVSNNSCNTITKLISSKNNDDQRETMMINTERVKKMMIGMMTIEHNSSNNSCNIFTQTNEENVAGNQPMNISELIFSHINDKNDTLIVINADNTVNITCDFNYLNYKIKHKINDQIHKDNASVKDKSCYNNTTTNEEESNTTTNNKDTSSLVDKKKTCYHQDDNISQTTVTQSKKEESTLTKIEELIECQRREKEMMRHFEGSERRLRLCGGGEGSLSGASGWGSPPSNTAASNANNNNNPNAGQWGATAQQTPQQNWSAAQQGGQAASQQIPPLNPVAPGQPQAGQAQNPNQKPLTPGGPSGGWNQPPQAQIPIPPVQQQQVPQVPGAGGNGAPGIVGGGTSAVAAKNQLEQLNSMREALFAQDGWGCQNVNQDTNWDVPGSPEPGPRTGDPAVATQWKSHTINNGTELWEANLRNGGQPPPQPAQKTPWNHTPTTNIGGTWGEDDDGGDNAWAGNPSQQAPGWNQSSGANPSSGGGTGMWPATPGKHI